MWGKWHWFFSGLSILRHGGYYHKQMCINVSSWCMHERPFLMLANCCAGDNCVLGAAARDKHHPLWELFKLDGCAISGLPPPDGHKGRTVVSQKKDQSGLAQLCSFSSGKKTQLISGSRSEIGPVLYLQDGQRSLSNTRSLKTQLSEKYDNVFKRFNKLQTRL